MGPDSGSDGELWRLHNRAGDVAICRVASVGGACVLSVLKSGKELLSEHHARSRAAHERAEEIRRQFIAEGWTGEFPRTP